MLCNISHMVLLAKKRLKSVLNIRSCSNIQLFLKLFKSISGYAQRYASDNNHFMDAEWRKKRKYSFLIYLINIP